MYWYTVKHYRYSYVSGVHTDKIAGSFGVYGRGAFVEYVAQESRAAATESLRDLEVQYARTRELRPVLPAG